MEDRNFGYIKINLDACIKHSGISKNKLANKAEMQRTQLNNYCKGNIQRVDLAVLSRLCSVLQCTIGEILEYVPAESDEDSK